MEQKADTSPQASEVNKNMHLTPHKIPTKESQLDAIEAHDVSSVDANYGSAPPSMINVTGGSYQHQDGSGLTATSMNTLEIDGNISQLGLWAYEVSDAKLTFAKKLEKTKWEFGHGGD